MKMELALKVRVALFHRLEKMIQLIQTHNMGIYTSSKQTKDLITLVKTAMDLEFKVLKQQEADISSHRMVLLVTVEDNIRTRVIQI